jgi:predicted DNA-binding protein
VEVYEKVKQQAANLEQEVPAFIKEIIEREIMKMVGNSR